jgi:hypothetical protein
MESGPAASCDRTSLYFPFSKSQYIRVMVWYSQEEDGLDSAFVPGEEFSQ